MSKPLKHIVVGMATVAFFGALLATAAKADTVSVSQVTLNILAPSTDSEPTNSTIQQSFHNDVVTEFGSANATATYGSLHGVATASQSLLNGNVVPPGYLSASIAQAQFTDSLTFLNVTSGDILSVTTSLTGAITTIDPHTKGAFAQGYLQTDLNDFNQTSAECVQYNTDRFNQCTARLKISSDDVVQFKSFLSAAASITGLGSVEANFGDTGKVVSLVVLDSQMRVDTDAGIVAASGTQYATATPEPASWMFLGVGLISIVWLGVRRGFAP